MVVVIIDFSYLVVDFVLKDKRFFAILEDEGLLEPGGNGSVFSLAFKDQSKVTVQSVLFSCFDCPFSVKPKEQIIFIKSNCFGNLYSFFL